MAAAMKIDAHQHFWELRPPFDHRWLDPPLYAPIRRNALPDDLKPLIDEVGVERTIFVQTQHMLAENDWVLQLASQYDFVAGVVGWVDLASPDCERQLEALLVHPKFVGVRHITHDEPDDNFIVRDDVLRGLSVLEKHRVPFDLLFFVRHLRHASTLAQAVPELPMVIDHLAKPPIRAGVLDSWLPDLHRAADFPNVYCKLSGMVTEADWNAWRPEHLKPYIDAALGCFGPERCMFGSDWPVCELAGTFAEVHDALASCIAELSDAEQAAIFGGTARRFYDL
jgi:L-fuconolactonase